MSKGELAKVIKEKGLVTVKVAGKRGIYRWLAKRWIYVRIVLECLKCIVTVCLHSLSMGMMILDIIFWKELEDKKVNTVWLVIPCYNEKEVLPETSRQLKEIMEGLIKKGKISKESKIAFVNDGSKDTTWNIIRQLHDEEPIFVGINLAHNRGHQNALFAGLMTAKEYADAAISLDADLQDDVAAIEQFIDKFLEGKDIVYGVRSTRETDTRFKRGTAHAFYKLMNAMGADTLEDHADYRLMSKRALEALAEYEEVNLFLRGIVPMIGFETDVVYYKRHERFAGESKYPLKKMLAFAVEGITSFSIKPIRMITTLGFFLFSISVLLLVYFFVLWLVGHTVAGWTTIVLSVWGIGGLQLLALGVIGEYIGKTYMEVKHRPRYKIESVLYQPEKE